MPLSFRVAHVVVPLLSSRPGSSRSRYDALESSHRGCRIATGQARRSNHSPYSEPAVLVAPYDSAPDTPRPRSSSAALDRGGPVIPQVSYPSVHRFTQLAYVDTPSRYPQFPPALHARKRIAPYPSSREPSPDSRVSFSPSPADSPSQLQIDTVPRSKGWGLRLRRAGDLGLIYDFQWRYFRAEYLDAGAGYSGKGVEQLHELIHKIEEIQPSLASPRVLGTPQVCPSLCVQCADRMSFLSPWIYQLWLCRLVDVPILCAPAIPGQPYRTAAFTVLHISTLLSLGSESLFDIVLRT